MRNVLDLTNLPKSKNKKVSNLRCEITLFALYTIVCIHGFSTLKFFSVNAENTPEIKEFEYEEFSLNEEIEEDDEELNLEEDINDESIETIEAIEINLDEMTKEEILNYSISESKDNNFYDIYGVNDNKLLNNSYFTLTTGNKTYEHLSYDDFSLFAAIVEAESSDNKNDALAVASSILNRCDSEKWVDWLESMGKDGTNPIDHIKVSGQYEVYNKGIYEEYLDLNVSDCVFDACIDCWYNGVRNNTFCSFRASEATDYSNNQVVSGGNRFNDKIVKVKTIDE